MTLRTMILLGSMLLLSYVLSHTITVRVKDTNSYIVTNGKL